MGFTDKSPENKSLRFQDIKPRDVNYMLCQEKEQMKQNICAANKGKEAMLKEAKSSPKRFREFSVEQN